MAEPVRRAVAASETPPVDPGAVEHAYRHYRARRRAEIARNRERAQARLRFFAAVFVLVAVAIVLMLTLWHEVQHIFGL